MTSTEPANEWLPQMDSKWWRDIETRVLAAVPPSVLGIRRFWPPLGDTSTMSWSLKISLAYGGNEPSSGNAQRSWRI